MVIDELAGIDELEERRLPVGIMEGVVLLKDSVGIPDVTGTDIMVDDPVVNDDGIVELDDMVGTLDEAGAMGEVVEFIDMGGKPVVSDAGTDDGLLGSKVPVSVGVVPLMLVGVNVLYVPLRLPSVPVLRVEDELLEGEGKPELSVTEIDPVGALVVWFITGGVGKP